MTEAIAELKRRRQEMDDAIITLEGKVKSDGMTLSQIAREMTLALRRTGLRRPSGKVIILILGDKSAFLDRVVKAGEGLQDVWVSVSDTTFPEG